MTLQEYESDVNYLLEIFRRRHSERIQFLDRYLKAKDYKNEELQLLIFMAEDSIVEEAISNIDHLSTLTIKDGEAFLKSREGKKTIRKRTSTRDPWELVKLLSNRLKAPAYKFETIGPRYLHSGQDQKLAIAESYMITWDYFHQDGSWNEDREVGDLVTFLNLLETAKIIKYTSEKDMNSFFAKRYKMQEIGSLMRPNKFKLQKKFHRFQILINDLGLKLETLLNA